MGKGVTKWGIQWPKQVAFLEQKISITSYNLVLRTSRNKGTVVRWTESGVIGSQDSYF